MSTGSRKPTTLLGVIAMAGIVIIAAAAVAGTLAQLGVL